MPYNPSNLTFRRNAYHAVRFRDYLAKQHATQCRWLPTRYRHDETPCQCPACRKLSQRFDWN